MEVRRRAAAILVRSRMSSGRSIVVFIYGHKCCLIAVQATQQRGWVDSNSETRQLLRAVHLTMMALRLE